MDSATLAERVLSRIKVTADGHWLYTGSLCKNGYPKIRIGKKFFLVHRLTLAWATGNDGIGLDACHDDSKNCPRHCINPEHLAWKSHRENMLDVITKHGRLGLNRKVASEPLPLLAEVSA